MAREIKKGQTLTLCNSRGIPGRSRALADTEDVTQLFTAIAHEALYCSPRWCLSPYRSISSPAKPLACRNQFALQEQCHSALRRAFLLQNDRLNPLALQSFRRSPSHAMAEHGIAVTERFHNGGMAVRAMFVMLPVGALPSGVNRESVAPLLLSNDLAIHDVEN